jgi:hypothetical protein
MRMAGRFARRVRAWANAHQVPVIDCKRGERKHQLAEEYLASHSVGPGCFLWTYCCFRGSGFMVVRVGVGRVRLG